MTDSPFPVLVERLRDLAADPAAVTDADLLGRFVRDRDPVAFEALVWRHARLVMGVCRRTLRHHQDAEDAFQAVFLLLARKAHRIRRGAALPAWLHTTAVRIARRARRRRGPVLVAEVPDQPIADPSPEAAEAWTALDAEVRRLPARLRAAFVLCGLEGRSHADAARDLGVPKGTIDSRMAAAKRRLRTTLSRRGLGLAPATMLTAAVPELAYSDAARRAAALGLGRSAGVSPAVAGLLAPAGASRWLAGLAAAVTLAAAGTLAVMSGAAGPGDPPKPPDKPADGPKATAERRLPATTPLFKRTTIGLPADDELHADAVKPAVDWLTKKYATAAEARRKSGRPLIPPATPVGSDDLVVYAHDRGFGSLYLRENKAIDPPFRVGELFWNLDIVNSFIRIATSFRSPTTLDSLVKGQPPEDLAELLFNRTLSVGFTLHDGAVYTVDELGIMPASPAPKDGILPRFGVLNAPMSENMVEFWDRETGKLLMKGNAYNWLDPGMIQEKGPIDPTIYLGPPVAVDDRAFVIHQADQRMNVTALYFKPLHKSRAGRERERVGKDSVAWDSEIVVSPRPMLEDVHRRIHAIHLTRAGDLIVCPTHLGRVVAVEAKTGKVRWTHEYAPLDAKRFPTFAPEWVVVPPVVTGDRYVYAPADFPELLCLNVADGKKVWSVKKDDGLYPAVAGEQVLVIGEKAIRSLSLKDGSEQWKAELPGLPCGRGAVLGDTYLVPVSEPKTWKGLIAVVDLKAGKVAEVLRPEKDEPIGNLVVHGDFLISQTLTEIAVFPIKKRE